VLREPEASVPIRWHAMPATTRASSATGPNRHSTCAHDS
jgi:hypothetical protein